MKPLLSSGERDKKDVSNLIYLLSLTESHVEKKAAIGLNRIQTAAVGFRHRQAEWEDISGEGLPAACYFDNGRI